MHSISLLVSSGDTLSVTGENVTSKVPVRDAVPRTVPSMSEKTRLGLMISLYVSDVGLR